MNTSARPLAFAAFLVFLVSVVSAQSGAPSVAIPAAVDAVIWKAQITSPRSRADPFPRVG